MTDEFGFQPNGDEDDPTSRLLGGAWVGGMPFHVTAIAVKDDEFSLQEAVTQEDDEVLALLAVAFQPDGGWQTARINERDYVLFFEPHSR